MSLDSNHLLLVVCITALKLDSDVNKATQWYKHREQKDSFNTRETKTARAQNDGTEDKIVHCEPDKHWNAGERTAGAHDLALYLTEKVTYWLETRLVKAPGLDRTQDLK